jgi:hypothetical protein
VGTVKTAKILYLTDKVVTVTTVVKMEDTVTIVKTPAVQSV